MLYPVMLLGIGFLMLVSLIVSAALSALGNYASGPATERHILWGGINAVVSLAVVTVLFAMILKMLPESNGGNGTNGDCAAAPAPPMTPPPVIVVVPPAVEMIVAPADPACCFSPIAAA